MAGNNFFKRKTQFERLEEQKKAKAEKTSKSKENYEESRVRTFDVSWEEKREWLEYKNLAELYSKNIESLKEKLFAIKRDGTFFDDTRSVENVMICVEKNIMQTTFFLWKIMSQRSLISKKRPVHLWEYQFPRPNNRKTLIRYQQLSRLSSKTKV